MEVEPAEVVQLHINMVNDIAGDIAKSLPHQWSKLTFGLNGIYLSDAEISTAQNMRDICKLLMDKKIISYGRYGRLREVIVFINKMTCDKIDKYTNLIQQTRVAARSESLSKQRAEAHVAPPDEVTVVTKNENEKDTKLSQDEVVKTLLDFRPHLINILSMDQQDLSNSLITKRRHLLKLEESGAIPTETELDLRAAVIMTSYCEEFRKLLEPFASSSS